MKRILLFSILWFMSLPLQPVSGSGPEITMLYFYQDGCPWCAQMNTVLHDPEVKPMLARHNRIIRVNVRGKKNISGMDMAGTDLIKKLKVTGTPTILFIDRTEKVLLKIPGALEKQDFLDVVCEYLPDMKEEAVCRGRGESK